MFVEVFISFVYLILINKKKYRIKAALIKNFLVTKRK